MNWYDKVMQEMNPQEVDNLDLLVEKIMNGRKDWTDAELEMYQNFPNLIENILKNEIEKTDKIL